MYLSSTKGYTDHRRRQRLIWSTYYDRRVGASWGITPVLALPCDVKLLPAQYKRTLKSIKAEGPSLKFTHQQSDTMLSQALHRADSIARHFETVFLFTKADVRTTLIPVVCHGDDLCPSYESYSPVHFRPYSHWLRHRHITSASPCMQFSGYGSIYCSSISQIRFRIRKRTARTSHPVRYLLVGFL